MAQNSNQNQFTDPNQQQPQYTAQNQGQPQYYQQPQVSTGLPMSPVPPLDALEPRRMSFFTLVLKTLVGFVGGSIGSMLLLLVYLGAASVLSPVLSPAESQAQEISPLFIVILMGMVFLTSVGTSLIAPLFLSFTERERYPRITTSLYQIFIFNIIIFAFVVPVYLTTSIERLELSAYAAGLQVVLSALSASLVMEIMNDYKYALLGVYTSVLGVLVSTAVNLFLFKLFGSPTILLFAALPITWATIGFFQSAFAMVYYWYFTTWGKDPLATDTQLGADYGVSDEPEEVVLPEDRDGQDFLKQ